MYTGLLRSNALRGTKFTDPASAAPGVSGVGERLISTREMLLIETWSSSTARRVPAPAALAISNPPIEIGTLSAGAPLIENRRASPPV